MNPRWKNRPPDSNWGEFGADDQRGRMNWVTREKVLQGVAEVKEGLSFVLSLPLDYPGGNVLNPRRHPPRIAATERSGKQNFAYQVSQDNPMQTDVVCDDLVLLTLQYSTQWDSFAHMGSLFDADGDGKPEPVFYNGFRAGVDVLPGVENSKAESWARYEGSRAEALGIGACFISAFVILAHMAIKSYDLVIALTNGGPGRSTWLPSVFMYQYSFTRNEMAVGAASAVLMLAAISHDLRTQLTLLRLRAEGGEAGEERERMLKTIADMEGMLTATLSFARDEAKSEQRKRMDVGALVSSIADDMADAGLPVVVGAIASAAVAECKPAALRRAVTNLIDNAVKYANKATVGVAMNTEAIEITVDDDGPGIPEDELSRVFQPFYRLESSRNRDSGGIGLGLAIAASIAQAHNGALTLSNRAEGGLRARLTLAR